MLCKFIIFCCFLSDKPTMLFLPFFVCNNSLLQMTVVDAYICGKKFDPSENQSVLPPKVASLLIEGIAQNTTGSVFLSEVVNRAYLLSISIINIMLMHTQFLWSHKFVMHVLGC